MIKPPSDKPLVIVTRPKEAGEELVPEITARGWEAFLEPMSVIEPLSPALPPLGQYAGLVFTSANGGRAFGCLSERRDLPVYTVGQATAKAAKKAGFATVHSGGGTAEKLEEFLATVPALQGKKLLHLSGYHVARTVSVPGIQLDRLVLYRAVAVQSLSPACLALLDSRHSDAIFFFSPRSAEIFSALVQQHGRTGAVSSIKALCIADSVVKSLQNMAWKDVQVAQSPTRAGVLALLSPATEAGF